MFAPVSVDTEVEAIAEAPAIHYVDRVIVGTTSYKERVKVDSLDREVNRSPQASGFNQLF